MYWLTLVPLSALCGILAAFVFRRFASPELGKTVNRIIAHLMELWLFFDEPELILEAQRDLLRENIRMFRQIAVPLAITAPLLALVVWQADGFFGRGTLPAGEAAVVTAHVRSGDLSNVQLRTPPDVRVETPGCTRVRLDNRAQSECSSPFSVVALAYKRSSPRMPMER